MKNKCNINVTVFDSFYETSYVFHLICLCKILYEEMIYTYDLLSRITLL